MFEYLKENGIAPQVHYVPVHKQPVMNNTNFAFPNAEYYYRGCISLPMFPSLNDSDQERVISAVKAFCSAR
jgi:dTDP-4-amino-4,6-dideoxygalactose transaminase